MSASPALFSSATAEWLTPEEVREPLLCFAGPDGVALDPCSHTKSIIPARARWVYPSAWSFCVTCQKEDVEPGCHVGHAVCDAHDGLRMLWTCGGLAWCNPPYGRELAKWAKKIAAEAAQGVEIISLVPARTDTVWWSDLTGGAAVWLAWRGRLRFLIPGADGRRKGDPAPFPTALVYHGSRWARFCEVFGPFGQLYRRLP